MKASRREQLVDYIINHNVESTPDMDMAVREELQKLPIDVLIYIKGSIDGGRYK